MGRATVVAIALSLAVASSVIPAQAQYFGRNKVEYNDLAFQILRTATLRHLLLARRAAGGASRRAYGRAMVRAALERPRSRLRRSAAARALQQPPRLRAYERHRRHPRRRHWRCHRIAATSHRDAVRGRSGRDRSHHRPRARRTRSSTTSPGAIGTNARMPLWMAEGMAEYLSQGPADPHTASWVRDAVQHRRLPSLEELGTRGVSPYRIGQAFWSYIGGRFGERTIATVLKTQKPRNNIERVSTALGMDADALSKDWVDTVTDTFEVPESGTAHDHTPTDHHPARRSAEHRTSAQPRRTTRRSSSRSATACRWICSSRMCRRVP